MSEENKPLEDVKEEVPVSNIISTPDAPKEETSENETPPPPAVNTEATEAPAPSSSKKQEIVEEKDESSGDDVPALSEKKGRRISIAKTNEETEPKETSSVASAEEDVESDNVFVDLGFNSDDDDDDDEFEEQLDTFEDTGCTEQDFVQMAKKIDEEFTTEIGKDEMAKEEDYAEEDDQEVKIKLKKGRETLQTIESEKFFMSKKFVVEDHMIQDRLDRVLHRLKEEVISSSKSQWKKLKKKFNTSNCSHNFLKLLVGLGHYCAAVQITLKLSETESVTGLYIVYIDPTWDSSIVFSFENEKNDYHLSDMWMSPLGAHIVVSLESNDRNDDDQSRFLHYYMNAFVEEYKIRSVHQSKYELLYMFKSKDILKLDFIESEQVTAVGWDVSHYQLKTLAGANIFDLLTSTPPKLDKNSAQIFFNSKTVLMALLNEEGNSDIVGIPFSCELMKSKKKSTTYIAGRKMTITSVKYKELTENTILKGLISFHVPISGIDIVRNTSKTVLILSSSFFVLFFEWDQDISTQSIGAYTEMLEMYNDGRKEAKSIMLKIGPVQHVPYQFILLRNTSVGSLASSDEATAFVWLSSQGIIHGDFLIDDIDYTISENNYSHLSRDESWKSLCGFTMTDFHIYTAYPEAIKIVMQPPELKASTSENTLLSSVVYQDSLKSFSKRTETKRYRTTPLVGICKDHYRDDDANEQMFIYSGDEVYYVNRTKNFNVPESKGIWKVYLEQATNPSLTDLREDYYKKALDLCESEDKEHVRSAIGDFYCSLGYSNKLVEAAQYFALTCRDFEEIVTKIMEKDPHSETDALLTYLSKMLERILIKEKNGVDSSLKVEKICLCTWIVELYLHKINVHTNIVESRFNSHCSVEERKKQTERRNEAILKRKETRMRFRHFLETHFELLSGNNKKKSIKDSIYSLIESNGLESDALYFACLVGDYDKVIGQLISKGNMAYQMNDEKMTLKYFGDALQILQKFCIDKKEGHDELWYKYAPMLITIGNLGTEIIKDLKRYSNILDTKKILPALMKYIELDDGNGFKLDRMQEVKEHLKWVIDRKIVDETMTVVHNTYLWLYTSLHSEHENWTNELNFDQDNPSYDRDFAARVCMSLDSMGTDAVISLYSSMGLYEQALDQALNKNRDEIEHAKRIVHRITENRNLKRKLLLKIAQHNVAKDHNSGFADDSSAINLLKEFSDGIISLRDILAFYPPNTKIEDLVKEMKEALGLYEKQSEQLRINILEAIDDAELFRSSINSVGIEKDLTDQDKCDSCGAPILSTQDFYLFSCNHCFHGNCLTEVAIKNMERQIEYIQDDEDIMNDNDDDKTEEKKESKEKKESRKERDDTEKQKNGLIQNITAQIKLIREYNQAIVTTKQILANKQFKNIAEQKRLKNQIAEQQRLVSGLIAASCPYDGIGTESVKHPNSTVSLLDLVDMPLFTKEEEDSSLKWEIVDH